MLIILVYCKQHSNKVYLTKANIIWHFDFTSRNKSGNRVFLYCSPPPHKELISPKRFTNLPLESMLSILNWMGLMHTYRSPGVPQTPKSYNALIEVFKFIWEVETPIRSDPYLSQSHQDWGLWTFSSKVAEGAPPCIFVTWAKLIFILQLHKLLPTQ